ncbi:MAG TPA: lipid II flippase MurJ, partial [Ilumatobacteraceae bacterium]
GTPLRINANFRHPAIRQLARLSGWTLGYAIANQIAVFVVQNLAVSIAPGQQDAYTKAFTFFVLPHGLLAVSIATTFEPEFTRSITKRDRAGFIDRASLGVRLVAMLTIPAGFGLFVLRRAIIGGALQHREFTAVAALNTSRALAGFALGLAGFSIYLFVLRGFYAHHDARTPFIINLFENGINIVLAIILVGRYGVLGLGLSFCIAYIVSAGLALLILSYKVEGFSLVPIFASLWPMFLASVVMAEVVWFVARHVGGNSHGPAIVRLVVGTIVGGAVYVGALIVLRVPEWSLLKNRLSRRQASSEQV